MVGGWVGLQGYFQGVVIALLLLGLKGDRLEVKVVEGSACALMGPCFGPCVLYGHFDGYTLLQDICGSWFELPQFRSFKGVWICKQE